MKRTRSFALYLTRTLGAVALHPPRASHVLRQLEFTAWQSLPVVSLCVCFAAIVTIVESSFHMKLVVQNDALVPGFAAMLILRELGAVITALLLTSRVGAGIAAEIASMRTSEQIEALRMLGIDPYQFLVAPRLIAGIVGGMLLSILADLICLYAAMLVCDYSLGVSPGAFLTGMRAFVSLNDLGFAAIKGACFGAVIPLAACWYGMQSEFGAEGVGRATTNAVVASSVSIIVLDFLLTWVFSHF